MLGHVNYLALGMRILQIKRVAIREMAWSVIRKKLGIVGMLINNSGHD